MSTRSIQIEVEMATNINMDSTENIDMANAIIMLLRTLSNIGLMKNITPSDEIDITLRYFKIEGSGACAPSYFQRESK